MWNKENNKLRSFQEPFKAGFPQLNTNGKKEFARVLILRLINVCAFTRKVYLLFVLGPKLCAFSVSHGGS